MFKGTERELTGWGIREEGGEDSAGPRELLDSAQSQSLQANSPQSNPKKGSRTGPSFVAKAFLTALHHSPLTQQLNDTPKNLPALAPPGLLSSALARQS